MKKMKMLMLGGITVCALGLGVIVGAHHSEAVDVKAATETTVYYAVSSEVVGTYTVKLNINLKGDGDEWRTYNMEKTFDKYDGKDVYRCTYTDAYDGVGCMQIQLYDGDKWKSQQQPIGGWTSADYYNGKIYVHDTGWDSYTPGLETYIPMTADFFTNWTDDAGSFRNVGANCWNGKSLNALGSVMDGCLDHEGWTGTLNSRRWHQTTEWIYFQYGCANNNHVGEDIDVKLVFKLWSSADATSPSYEYDFHNDTFCQTTMLLRNFRVPSEAFAALGGDFYMSVDLVDGRGNDYGANEFGYLHVNQTHEQVSNAQWFYYTHCVEGEARSVDELRSNYYLNGSLRDGFVTGFAESFNTQFSFDMNWMKDGYGNDDGYRHQDRAISHSTYRNGSNMPFNSNGGFFKGWYGEGNDDYDDHVYGYVASDNSVYRFVSKPFRLPANGIVSIKMAGNGASLHLLDFDGGHGDLAWVDCRTFVSGGDENPIALTGKNVCTMVNHVINFSKYAGRLVQIGIADVANDTKAGGWQAAYFDELRADYDSLPGLNIDVVEQDRDGKSYLAIPDKYVGAVENQGGIDYALDDGPDADTSPLKNAASFVSDYLGKFRSYTGSGDAGFCTAVKDEGDNGGAAYVERFNNLTEAEKEVVCKSDDYRRQNATAENWYRVSPEKLFLSESLSYLALYLGMPISIDGSSAGAYRTFLFENSSSTITVIIVALVSTSSVGLFLVFKKRKTMTK